MNLTKECKFNSDRIEYLSGFDRSESKHILKWFRKHQASYPARLALGINTHYPELESGYYFNRRILLEIQKAMHMLDMSVVIEDNYSAEVPIPIEIFGSLEFDDDYILVNSNLTLTGRLRMWFSMNGRSSFYHDQVIVEIATFKSSVVPIIECLKKASENSSIDFVRCL